MKTSMLKALVRGRSALGAAALVGVLAVTGCAPTIATGAAPATTAPGQNDTPTLTAEPTADAVGTPATDTASVAQMLADNDDYTQISERAGQAWDASAEVAISLDGTSIDASGAGVQVNGATATITAPGTYRVTGTLSNGGLVVDTADDGVVRIVLDNADITNGSGAAIAALNADLTEIVVPDGSHSRLTDAASYADTSDDAPNATLWSSDDLAITGTGSLEIAGLLNDGINARDGLVIDGPSIAINAVDDGIRGKDYLVVQGGRIDITAVGDGLKSDGTLSAEDAGQPMVGYVAVLGGDVQVAVQDDGVTGAGEVIIGGGTLTVSQSYEGIEAAQVLIAGGTTTVTSTDDGVNAASDVYANRAVFITGGDLTITADGDGIDANGILRQTGGNVLVNGTTSGRESSVDADGAITLDGGTMLAFGSSGMLASPSADSAQGWLVAPLTQTAPAGTQVQILDANGTAIASYTLARDAQAVTYSAGNVQQGATYTVNAGGNQTTVVAGQSVGRGGGRGNMGPGPGGMDNPDGGRRTGGGRGRQG